MPRHVNGLVQVVGDKRFIIDVRRIIVKRERLAGVTLRVVDLVKMAVNGNVRDRKHREPIQLRHHLGVIVKERIVLIGLPQLKGATPRLAPVFV